MNTIIKKLNNIYQANDLSKNVRINGGEMPLKHLTTLKPCPHNNCGYLTCPDCLKNNRVHNRMQCERDHQQEICQEHFKNLYFGNFINKFDLSCYQNGPDLTIRELFIYRLLKLPVSIFTYRVETYHPICKIKNSIVNRNKEKLLNQYNDRCSNHWKRKELCTCPPCLGVHNYHELYTELCKNDIHK